MIYSKLSTYLNCPTKAMYTKPVSKLLQSSSTTTFTFLGSKHRSQVRTSRNFILDYNCLRRFGNKLSNYPKHFISSTLAKSN